MMKLTACILANNEEATIEDCLKSVSFCDEIIVVDNGSSDRTEEIVRKYTNNYYVHEWLGFSEQMVYMFSLAKTKWILNVDADERIDEQLKNSIINAMNAPEENQPAGYNVIRYNYYFGKFLRFGGWQEKKIRLLDKDKVHVRMDVPPHSKIITDGKTINLKGKLLHYSFKSMSNHLDITRKYSEISVQGYLNRKKRFKLRNLFFSPLHRFLVAYIFKLGFINGIQGFMWAIQDSFGAFYKYSIHWEATKFKPLAGDPYHKKISENNEQKKCEKDSK